MVSIFRSLFRGSAHPVDPVTRDELRRRTAQLEHLIDGGKNFLHDVEPRVEAHLLAIGGEAHHSLIYLQRLVSQMEDRLQTVTTLRRLGAPDALEGALRVLREPIELPTNPFEHLINAPPVPPVPPDQWEQVISHLTSIVRAAVRKVA